MRTYDVGRLFFVPLRIPKGERWIARTHTWETDGDLRFAHTLVFKLGPLPFGFGIGWWQDTDIESMVSERQLRAEVERANAEYDAYVAVNGNVDRAQWAAARRAIARRGLDPDDEMEAMQALGVFE
jgi:hypothetical protein